MFLQDFAEFRPGVEWTLVFCRLSLGVEGFGFALLYFGVRNLGPSPFDWSSKLTDKRLDGTEDTFQG